MTDIDDYVTGVLMRDLVGHDRRAASFLVYLWLAAEQQRRAAAVSISYQELAESIGIQKLGTGLRGLAHSTQAAHRQQNNRDRDSHLHRALAMEGLK